MRVSSEVVVERLGVPSLEAVVELLPDRTAELLDELAGVDEVERADALEDEPRRLVEQLQVALDRGRGERPLDLHRDPAPVRQHRAMDLADRRRRDRYLVELEEEPLNRLSELLADDALDVGERERADVVLE